MEQGPVLSARDTGGRWLSADQIRARFAEAPAPGRRGSPTSAVGHPRVAASAPDARVRGDYDLNPDLLPEGPLRAAAVLVPLVLHADGITVLLTRRTDHLQAHPGQISFPGGVIDPCDRTPEDAALREAAEEVGIGGELVSVVGRLDTYVTRTGFEVMPVVGLVEPGFTPTPHSYEVAEVFEVPLGFLVDPANHRRDSRVYAGATRFFYAMPWNNYYIWGATAGMLVNLSELLWQGALVEPPGEPVIPLES